MNITYSPLSEEIIDYKINWLNNSKVNRYLYGAEDPKKTTLKKQQVWFAKYQQDNSSKFFTILVEGKAVGMVGLTKINQLENVAEIFILVGDENYWNKGIGTQAMNYIINYAQDNLKLKELNLSVHKDNKPAIELFSKVGFNELSSSEKEIEMKKNLRETE